MKGYCKIDNDSWDFIGKVFAVHSYFKPEESTGVQLTLENVNTGEFHKITTPIHSIDWLD